MKKHDLQLATPCKKRWEMLDGDGDTTRFCTDCQADVVHLSHMTEDDARRLVDARRSTGLCIIYEYDAQGNVAFRADGARNARWHHIKRWLLGAAMVAPMVPMLTACGGMERRGRQAAWQDNITTKIQDDERRAVEDLKNKGIHLEQVLEDDTTLTDHAAQTPKPITPR